MVTAALHAEERARLRLVQRGTRGEAATAFSASESVQEGPIGAAEV